MNTPDGHEDLVIRIEYDQPKEPISDMAVLLIIIAVLAASILIASLLAARARRLRETQARNQLGAPFTRITGMLYMEGMHASWETVCFHQHGIATRARRIPSATISGFHADGNTVGFTADGIACRLEPARPLAPLTCRRLASHYPA